MAPGDHPRWLAGGQELAPLLAELHAPCFDDPWSAENFAALLIHRGAAALVLALGDTPVGFVVTQQVADEAEILTIGILPTHRQGGRGRQLLGACMQRLADAGCRQLFLEVAADNRPALQLYQSAGFHEAGRRANYYRKPDGSRMDALILRAEISAEAPDQDKADA